MKIDANFVYHHNELKISCRAGKHRIYLRIEKLFKYLQEKEGIDLIECYKDYIDQPKSKRVSSKGIETFIKFLSTI